LAVTARGLRLNPGSITLLSQAVGMQANWKLPDATRRARCALLARMNPGAGPGCEVLRLLAAGDTSGARAQLHAIHQASAEAIAKMSGARIAYLARDLARVGDTADARTILGMAVAKSATEYVREDVIAQVYFRLGDLEQSIAWWSRAVESNGAQVVWLATRPEYESFRKDPRIKALLEKAGVKNVAP
jgi:tetratricopeptide (TPR) repeat protein